VSFATITICVASERVFIVVCLYFVMTQPGNIWIHHRMVIKWRRIRCAGHLARMGEMSNACNILIVKPVEKRPLGILCLAGNIILKLILGK